jgi:hypothetical protein
MILFCRFLALHAYSIALPHLPDLILSSSMHMYWFYILLYLRRVLRNWDCAFR